MEAPSPQPAEPAAYVCPACGAPVAAPDPPGPVLQCPACGEQFFVPSSATSDAEETAEAQAARHRQEIEAQRELDLSEMHIRQISQLRRGAIRSRSWLLIAAVVLLVAAAQLIYMAFKSRRLGLHGTPIVELGCAVACVVLCRRVGQRVRDLGREIRQSRLQDPAAPPDFSTLSDGSQRYKNLEELGKQHDDQ